MLKSLTNNPRNFTWRGRESSISQFSRLEGVSLVGALEQPGRSWSSLVGGGAGARKLTTCIDQALAL